MIDNNNGLVILLRVFIGAAICPYIPALLLYAPTYITNVNSEFFMPVFHFVTIVSYVVALLFGLPITLYLAIKNKCSYKTFVKTGFMLGALTSIAFLLFLQYMPDILSVILGSLWYGFCAAVGAVSFGFISGLPKRYNKAFKRDGKQLAPLN